MNNGLLEEKERGLGPVIFDPGPDGFDFILKVKSKAPDKDGRVWPDYSDSMFDRQPRALGTDDEIETIMSSTYSLDEYIKGLEKTMDEMIGILKFEELWGLVEADYRKYNPTYRSEATTELEEQHEAELETVFGDSPTNEDDEPPFDTEDASPEDEMEQSDADLLKELEDM